jgi:predicted  nucleic acid-binding Zn-ribbon protein
MSHAHHWRATSKVFALVCECGVVYHDWLLAEVDRMKKEAIASQSVPSAEEITALRAQLEEARRERDALRGELDEARKELETRAAAITQSVTS